MNVFIEVNPLHQAERTGVANYLHFWLRAMLAQAPGDQFTLWSPEMSEHPFPEFSNAAFRGRRFPCWSRTDYDRLWSATKFGALPADVDVYHLPFFARPAPRRGKTKLVVTVYDLAFAYYPEVCPDVASFRFLSEVLPEQTAQADRIIVISHSTARDLQSALNVPPEKISVIYPGNDLTADAIQPLPVALEAQLPPRYVLCTGTWEPRKNLPALFRAFALLRAQGIARDVKLVLAGGRGWKYEESERMVESLGLQENIVRLGYVPRESLPALYARSLFFVYPSLYEGFGLPVVEAMACGAPVVTSNVSSLPEAAGDAALLIDPHNDETLAEAMRRLLEDEGLRDDLRQKGFAQSAKFSWEENARATLEVYRELAQL